MPTPTDRYARTTEGVPSRSVRHVRAPEATMPLPVVAGRSRTAGSGEYIGAHRAGWEYDAAGAPTQRIPRVRPRPPVRDETRPADGASDPLAEAMHPPHPDPGIEDLEHEPQPPSGGGRSLLKGTALQVLGQFLPLVGNLALTPFIIQGLSKEIYAIYLLMNVIQGYVQAVDGGIGPSANRYFTLYAGQDDRVATTRLLTSLVVVVSAIAAVVFAGVYLATPSIMGFFGDTTRHDLDGAMFFFRTMIVLIAINQVRQLFAFVLFAQHRFGVTTGMGLLGYVIYVIGTVWTIQTHHGLVGLAWMFVVQQCVATLFIVPSACRFLDRRGIGFVSLDILQDFFRYSWKAQLSSLLDVTATSSDQLIVAHLRPRSLVAFSNGASFAQQLKWVPLNAFSPIQATVGRAVGADGERSAVATFERIQRGWVVFVTGWVAVGAPAMYFGLTAWLHAQLQGSTLPGVVGAILLLGNLFALLASVQVIWCLSVGRSDLELRYGIVGLVLNLVGTIGLIVPFGVVGSVAATAVSQLLATAYLVMTMRRRLEVSPRSPFGLVPWLPAVVCAALSFAGAWGASLLTGSVVPYGGLSLVVCGLGAAPAFVLYLYWAVGLDQVRAAIAARRGVTA